VHQVQIGESKGLLKHVLARRVPREMIYRTKVGFVPPIAELLREPSVQDLTRAAVLAEDNPLQPYLHGAVVRDMLTRVWDARPLSLTAFNFVWVLLFTSCWLRGLPATPQTR